MNFNRGILVLAVLALASMQAGADLVFSSSEKVNIISGIGGFNVTQDIVYGRSAVFSGSGEFESIDVSGGFSGGGISMAEGELWVYGNLYLLGDLTAVDIIYLQVNGTMYPTLTNMFDLGNETFLWRDLYLSGALKSDNNEIVVDGNLSVLGDGAFTGALYVDGVSFNKTDIENWNTAYGWGRPDLHTVLGHGMNSTRPIIADSDGNEDSIIGIMNINSQTGMVTVDGSINMTSGNKLYVPEICLSGDCQTSWPTGGGGGYTPLWYSTSGAITSNASIDYGNVTISGDLNIMGTMRGGSPVKVAGGMNITTGDVHIVGGSLGVGTLSPERRLHVEGGARITGSVFYGGNLTGQGADFAEMFAYDGEISAGDLVCIRSDMKVERCSQRGQTSIVGVASNTPTIIGNAGKIKDGVPVAIIGLVDVKVVGFVNQFDLLTSSAEPGYAEKAYPQDYGAIVGKALEPCYSGECKVKMLVGLQ
ncbi:MAG TPA: hypothetical protein ENN13_02615 [Candidatus Altiarchaeales archaeon]|nr:hypothetical protein [Candidatus Altiarchaeales archaeon]